MTQAGQKSAVNDYAVDKLWIETHYPDPRPFGERVTANRRRTYVQAILVLGVLVAGMFLLVPLRSTRPVHGSGWTEVSGLVLELVGVALFLRALKRRGARRPRQVWYFCALNARQRRHLLNQARGRVSADADEVPFVRRLAQRAIAERARALDVGVGAGIFVIGEGVRAVGTWRWFMLTLAALCVAGFAASRRRMHEMKDFLLLHPDD